MPSVEPVPGTDATFRVTIDKLDQGWSTRSFPHALSDRQLYVADNAVFNRDGLVSKRPGNIAYGGTGATGKTGSAQSSQSGARLYVGTPPAGQLVVQSAGSLYRGTDPTGAFASIATGYSTSTPATYAQMYDPDFPGGGRVVLVVCDGTRVPQLYDGTLAPVAAKTGSSTPTGETQPTKWLPNAPGGAPITPRYVCEWGYHLVLAGEPTDPTAIYISDALRPERFNGYGLVDSAGTAYTPYYPAGRGGQLGVVTGVVAVGTTLLVFFSAGVVAVSNTGTSGAYEYVFAVISRSTGSPSPTSIVPFGGYVIFFGGDRFYATDGETVFPIPDEIPSVYASNSRSVFPCEMKNKRTVVGARVGLQYWASYDGVGAGPQSTIAVFDLSAAGGWTYGAPTGGAWSRWPTGMPLSWALECRGPSDDFQVFWGSSSGDRIAQFDTGTSSDFGAAITFEARAKAYYLDRPVHPKDVQSLSIVAALQTSGANYTDALTAYVITDTATQTAPTAMIGAKVSGTTYGTAQYGQFAYGGGNQIITAFAKTFPAQDAKGTIVQPGVIESSTNPFNLVAMVLEVIVDEPT